MRPRTAQPSRPPWTGIDCRPGARRRSVITPPHANDSRPSRETTRQDHGNPVPRLDFPCMEVRRRCARARVQTPRRAVAPRWPRSRPARWRRSRPRSCPGQWRRAGRRHRGRRHPEDAGTRARDLHRHRVRPGLNRAATAPSSIPAWHSWPPWAPPGRRQRGFHLKPTPWAACRLPGRRHRVRAPNPRRAAIAPPADQPASPLPPPNSPSRSAHPATRSTARPAAC